MMQNLQLHATVLKMFLVQSKCLIVAVAGRMSQGIPFKRLRFTSGLWLKLTDSCMIPGASSNEQKRFARQAKKKSEAAFDVFIIQYSVLKCTFS